MSSLGSCCTTELKYIKIFSLLHLGFQINTRLYWKYLELFAKRPLCCFVICALNLMLSSLNLFQNLIQQIASRVEKLQKTALEMKLHKLIWKQKMPFIQNPKECMGWRMSQCSHSLKRDLRIAACHEYKIHSVPEKRMPSARLENRSRA